MSSRHRHRGDGVAWAIVAALAVLLLTVALILALA